MQANWGQDEPVGDVCPEPNVLNLIEADERAGKEGILARGAHAPPFPKRLKNPSPTDLPARKKHNAVPSHLLNADPLAQIIGMETVVDVIIDNAEVSALVDSGATADLMSSAYAEARGFDVRSINELSDQYVNLNLALGYSSPVTGFVEYNLWVKGVSSYDSDRVALLAKGDTQLSKEVPLTIGTKTEDSIFKAMKEGEVDMLDNVWKQVKNNHSLSKLREKVEFWQAVAQIAEETGEKPPEFKDHTPFSNKGMEDLLKLNELVSTVRTEIIPPWSNKTIKAQTLLVLMGVCMNVMMEPLHRNDKVLPQGLHVRPSYSTFNCSNRKTDVQLYNTKDHPIVLSKGAAVARMIAANEVPRTVVADGTVGTLQTCRWTKEGRAGLSVAERKKILFEKLELSGLKSWTEENKQKALNLLAKYHDIFALEDGKMGCTEVVEHKIKVTDPRPFKERPRNIPSGLLDEVKEHLDHMLDVGAIKPSKSDWSNAVVLVHKKDGGLRFCIDLQKMNAQTRKDGFLLPRIHNAIDALSGSKYYTTIDLLSGFCQTLTEESLEQYTAFTVGTLGFFQCEHMPFGLCNALATFQWLMTNCLGELNLKLKPSKCEFFREKIEYLGHSVSLKGVWPSRDNLKAIAKYPKPTTCTTIKGFFGMVGQYQCFIKDFTKIADPLHEYACSDAAKRKKE